MNLEKDVLQILDRSLGLQGRALAFGASTPLLGALAELDSLALTALIAGIEAHFGVIIADDEVEGRHFADVAALTALVRAHLPA